MKTFSLLLKAFYTGLINRRLGILLFICLQGIILGCATIKPITPVETTVITFKTEKQINGGKKLPIDIIYVTYVQELREVTKYGPELWFGEGDHREEWKQKESISIEGGETRTIELNPRILERTVLIVILADYENQTDPSKQQVIVDYAGKTNEVVLVREDSIVPDNKSLRYVK